MSGIAGVIGLDGAPQSQDLLDRIIAATPHRQDDGVGHWRSGPAFMIRFHRPATPESLGESQPLLRAGATICFDGRLDNRDELLRLLAERQALSPTVPDCEIVLALAERFGDRVVERLVGDFAFAIWDAGRRRLYCARSAGGWCPFLWTLQGDTFAFASHPPSLVRGLGMDRRLNEAAIGEYLSSRFVTQTETFWQGIQRLAQGSALVVEGGRVRSWLWHRGPFEDFSRLSEADHVDRFNELFDQALISSMRSATPVAAQLSGGLDSSAIVCRATELYRAGRIAQPVTAISARFPGRVHDETEWSETVESHLGIEAQTVSPGPYDFEQAEAWSASSLQLPLRPNATSWGVICESLGSQGSRVVLTGEGGDDWLRGSWAHWADMFRSGRWPALLREGWEANDHLPAWRRPRAILSRTLGPLLSRQRRQKLLHPDMVFSLDLPPWIKPDWAERIGLVDRWRDDRPTLAGASLSQQWRYAAYVVPTRHVLLDNIIAYADTQGVEVRHPFHDLRLTRFLMGASGGMLRRRRQPKHLLREAMRQTLPESVRTRRTKADFSMLIVEAVVRRLRERGVGQLEGVRAGWLDGPLLEQYLTMLQSWHDDTPGEMSRFAALRACWGAVSIDLWLTRAFRL